MFRRFGRTAAWMTVALLAAATTWGVLFFALISRERPWVATNGKASLLVWLLVPCAALAPWWALATLAVHRERGRAGGN